MPLSRTRRAQRQRLLQAAQSLFIQAGYHGTTMEGVAKSAAVSKATLYKYFADKDDLLVALVHEGLLEPDRGLEGQIEEALTSVLASLEDDMSMTETERAVAQLLRQARDRRANVFSRLVIEIALDHPALLARVRQAARPPSEREVRSDLDRRIPQRLPPELEIDVLRGLLVVFIVGYSVLPPAFQEYEGLTPERLAAGLASLLRGGLRSR